MADYAIGDLQGCYDGLMRLLDSLQFDDAQDRLWFTGDLVNRGSQSLEVLRFIKHLPCPAQITLGNHDLYLLSLVLGQASHHSVDPSLRALLKAEDCQELCQWLSQQKILAEDLALNIVICHAGIAPIWTLDQARRYARELETVLAGDPCREFLNHMFGNSPKGWSESLSGMTRLRVLCNYFTRMRFCFADGSLDFEHQGPATSSIPGLYPWYALPNRQPIAPDILFGHWAALEGQCPIPGIHALDTGYVWGGHLTALRLQDKQRFSVAAS